MGAARNGEETGTGTETETDKDGCAETVVTETETAGTGTKGTRTNAPGASRKTSKQLARTFCDLVPKGETRGRKAAYRLETLAEEAT